MTNGCERRRTMDHVSSGNEQSYLTPSEIARLLRVSSEKVLNWIRRAELKAVNVGNGFRPRYRISRDALTAFLAGREVQPPPERRRRKPQPPEGGPLDPALGEELLKKKQAVKVGKQYYRVWNGMILYF
jgi:excisionase family DNA binding protein